MELHKLIFVRLTPFAVTMGVQAGAKGHVA